jgi:hypothetical protein
LRYLSAIIGWIVVATFMVLTMFATAGFPCQGIGDCNGGAHRYDNRRSRTADQRIQAVEIAWRAADTATASRQAECAVRGPAMTRRPNVLLKSRGDELRGFVPSNTT